MSKSAFTSPTSPSPVPALASETFRREGSAETRQGELMNSTHFNLAKMFDPESIRRVSTPLVTAGMPIPETESSNSDHDRSRRTLRSSARLALMDRNDVENLSSNNGDQEIYYEGYLVGEKLHAEVLEGRDLTVVLSDCNTWQNGTNVVYDDDSLNRAISIREIVDGDASSEYSSCSVRNDEISIQYHGDSTVSYHETIAYDVESENFDHGNTGFEVHEAHEPNNFVVADEDEISHSTKAESSSRGSKRKAKKPPAAKRTKKSDCTDHAVAGPSSQHSTSASSTSRSQRTPKRGKLSRPRNTCRKSEEASSMIVEASPSKSQPENKEKWSTRQWDDFFDLFGAVAAEARTLRTLGSDNEVANERWLGVMRKLLQKPPV